MPACRIKNPEFHYINIRPVRHELEGSGILPGMGARWINGNGVHFMDTYDPVLKDRAPSSKIVLAAAKEAMKGNVPITIDVRGMAKEEREKFRLLMVSHGWQPILDEKCKREEGYDILRDNVEWQPAYESNKLGIDADPGCRTSLKGLFAAGMATTLGINPFTGWSIGRMHVVGISRRERVPPTMPGLQRSPRSIMVLVAAGCETFREPLKKKSDVDPDDLVRELQKILFPADVLIIMSESRLTNALGQVLALKEEQMPQLKAKDTRSLIKVKETQTMMLSAEMTLKAALMRKETRENIFYREDFPTSG